MSAERHSFAERAAEKAASRRADEEALASGAKSAEQLRAENTAFALPPGRVRLDLSKVTGKF